MGDAIKHRANFQDLTGKRFGRLVVIREVEPNTSLSSGKKRTQWLCRCDCGKEIKVIGVVLTAGKRTSCGCKRKEKRKGIYKPQYGYHYDDLKGQRFGRLVSLGRAIEYDDERRVHHYKIKCICDCGNIIFTERKNLVYGYTRSCGCLYKETRPKSVYGDMSKKRQRLYTIWFKMIKRCEDPNTKQYNGYGGRGVGICEEWHNFDVFFEWAIENGYEDNLSIDRIDNDGNYEPLNCRWADRETQANNTRTNVKIEMDGETHTIAEWARIFNMKYITLYSRLLKGYSLKEAVTMPLMRVRK